MSTMNVQFDADLIARLEQQGPRYTSYPTADRFRAGYNAAAWTGVLARRAEGAHRLPLSLYLHIPFCESLCYYCACNKIITKEHDKAVIYVDYLKREISMQAALLGQGERVEQLHLGGGTPTFLTDEQMDDVL
ncbi:MAG: coproporphyrinogen III oxidase, partial [Gammaproteobacteria bacterium]